MTFTVNQTLIDLLNNSSTVCIPQGYDKQYGALSIDSAGFIANNYFYLMYSFANAQMPAFSNMDPFEYFMQQAFIFYNEPYNPLLCDSSLLLLLKNVLGLQFVLENLSTDLLRQVLQAKLLANTSDGTIKDTIAVYSTLSDPLYVRRIRYGTSVDISYTAVGGSVPISTSELSTFWNEAVTGGVRVELRQCLDTYFGFADDPTALGFASISGTEDVLNYYNPYFGFADDPDAHGFCSTADREVGGHMATLVLPTHGGGSFATIVFPV